MSSLNGKVALVTGGASGLGAAIAALLHERGAHVIAADISEGKAGGGMMVGPTAARLDVTDEDDWKRVISDILSRHGRLDILVNNAGIVGPVGDLCLEQQPIELWRDVFRVNVEGAFLGCRAAIVAMRQRGTGAIINIASIAGTRATPHAPAYGASKAALHHLTLSVAQHCAQQNLTVRCCSVFPGDIRTPLWDRLAEERYPDAASREQFFTHLANDVPLGRLASPADVAAAVAFLVSDEARHVTATALTVDGGVTGCASFAERHARPRDPSMTSTVPGTAQ